MNFTVRKCNRKNGVSDHRMVATHSLEMYEVIIIIQNIVSPVITPIYLQVGNGYELLQESSIYS